MIEKFDMNVWASAPVESHRQDEMRKNSEGGPLAGYCKHDFPTLLVRSEIVDDLD